MVDDHPVTREGIHSVFENEPSFEVVGYAATAASAVKEVGRCQPEVVLLDLRLPDRSGLEIIERLTTSGCRVIALTAHGDEQSMVQAFRAGARGFLLKGIRPSLLREAVRAVTGDGTFVDPRVAARLVRLATMAGEPKGPFDLTRRELGVLQYFPNGVSNQEIADELGISVQTVKTHVRGILRKLGARDRAQAAGIAMREGLI